MQLSRKSLLMLVSMLVLGVVLGAAGMAGYRPRAEPPPDGQRPGRFVEHMAQTIQPRDSVQRAAIMSVLEATDRRNRETVNASESEMRSHLVAMQSELAPLLDVAQQERLTTLLKGLARPPRGGGPGGGPPGGGPPGGGPPGGGPPGGGPPPSGGPPGGGPPPPPP